MSQIELRKCLYLDISMRQDFIELVALYAEESSLVGLPKPKGNKDSYLALETAGLMHLFCAFIGDTIIGFANVLIVVMPHYGEKLATMESWFVAEEYRATGIGLRLRKAVELKSIEQGAIGITISATVGGKLASVMERQKSYVESHRVFFKALA